MSSALAILGAFFLAQAVITNAGNIPPKTLQPATSSSSCGCPHTTPPPMCNCNPPDHSHEVTEDLIANPWKYPFTKCCMQCMAIMEILTRKLDCCKRKWCTVLSGDYKTVRVVEIIETTEAPDSSDPDPTHPPGHTHKITQHVLDDPEHFLFEIGCDQCDETLALLIQILDNKPKGQKFKEKMKALKRSIGRAFCSKARYADDVIVEEY